MEILVSILSGLLAIGTSVNLVGDILLKKAIRSQVEEVDKIAVRIDNAPNHDILGGKVQRVRVATRGLKLSSVVTFKVLELDLDRINVILRELLDRDLFVDLDETPTIRLRQLFERPVRFATRVVLTEKQLDNILNSETVNSTLSNGLTELLNRIYDDEFTISSFTLDLKGNNRVSLKMKIPDTEGEYGEKGEVLDVDLELSIKVVEGKNFAFFDQKVFINGEPVPPDTDVPLARPLTLRVLEELGIKIRVLQLNSNEDDLELALFVEADEFAASALLDAEEFLENLSVFLEQ